MIPDTLSAGQFDTVYNFLSLVIAAQLFTAVFLLIGLPRILPRYRQAITVAIVVCGIAAYHYFRIFDSFKSAFVTDSTGGTGDYTQAMGEGFNEGYRYVDWLLTVPLLLLELIAVLALARKVQKSLLIRLMPAAALMIILGYPGEISGDNGVRGIFGLLSTIPFAYILYVLFVQLSKSLSLQPASVRRTLGNLRRLPHRLPASAARHLGLGRVGLQASGLLGCGHPGEGRLRHHHLPGGAPQVLRR